MRRRLLVAALAILGLLIVAQIVLPKVAEHRVRRELDRIGVVSDVKVSSFPAIKLLFGDIDSLGAKLSDSTTSDDQIAQLLAKADRIDRLRIAAERISISGLALADARLTKDGQTVRAGAMLDGRDLQSLLPAGTKLRNVSASDGQLKLDGSFSALGTRLSGVAKVSASDGMIVLNPQAGPLGGFARFTIFDDQRLRVGALDAQPGSGQLVEVSATARLTD